MQAGALGVVADLDFGVGQLAQFLNGLHIGGAHIGGGDDPQRTAVLGEFPQLIHQEPQAAPLDEGHQHVDAVGGDDLLFQLHVQLGLMDGPGEQAALSDGGLQPAQVGSRFANRQPRVLLPKSARSCSARASMLSASKSASPVVFWMRSTIWLARSICVEMTPPLSATFSKALCTTSARYCASTLEASALSMGAINLRESGISESSRFRAVLVTCS